MKTLIQKLTQKISKEIPEIKSRIIDWYITGIRHYFRTIKFLQRDIDEVVVVEQDYLDINHRELAAMRRIFDRAAINYT